MKFFNLDTTPSRPCQSTHGVRAQILTAIAGIHMRQCSINDTGPRGGSVRVHAHGSVDVSIGLMQIDKAPTPARDNARSAVATVGD